MSERTPEKALFDLALYLVCCARLAVEENVGLGSFRLVEGASRLIAAAGELGVPVDGFLEEQRAAIDADKVQVMWSMDAYVSALDEIQTRFVAEAKRRNAAGGDA